MSMRYLSRLCGLVLVFTACIDPNTAQGTTMNHFAASTTNSSARTITRTITVEKMTIAWHFIDDLIAVTAAAPTRGWGAVGFNQRDDIVGANLIMGPATCRSRLSPTPFTTKGKERCAAVLGHWRREQGGNHSPLRQQFAA